MGRVVADEPVWAAGIHSGVPTGNPGPDPWTRRGPAGPGAQQLLLSAWLRPAGPWPGTTFPKATALVSLSGKLLVAKVASVPLPGSLANKVVSPCPTVSHLHVLYDAGGAGEKKCNVNPPISHENTGQTSHGLSGTCQGRLVVPSGLAGGRMDEGAFCRSQLVPHEVRPRGSSESQGHVQPLQLRILRSRWASYKQLQ